MTGRLCKCLHFMNDHKPIRKISGSRSHIGMCLIRGCKCGGFEFKMKINSGSKEYKKYGRYKRNYKKQRHGSRNTRVLRMNDLKENGRPHNL